MKTTVALEADVVALISSELRGHPSSLEEVVNSSLREFYKTRASTAQRRSYRVKPLSLGWHPHNDNINFNQLNDEIEVDAIAAKMKRDGPQ